MDNFSNYEINTENGTVFSKISNRFIGTKMKKGYIRVTLHDDDGKIYHFQLHRLIWMEANGQIPSGYEIDHINTVRDDNRISNLRIMTHQENSNNPLTLQHFSERLITEKTKRKLSEAKKGKYKGTKHPMARAVAKLDKVTEEVLEIQPYGKRYTELYGFHNSAISRCCQGKLPHYKGYKWKYAY